MTNRGDWIQTYSGRAFYPLDPRPDDVSIVDIAHALAHLCRFGGHARHFYSVAEHSCTLAHYFDRHGRRDLARWALLHDASEAYVVDVPRPIKPMLAEYRVIEAGIMRAVCARFGLPVEEPAEVRAADMRILTDEARAVMAPPPMPWATEAEPLGVFVGGMPPEHAEACFLGAAVEFFGRAAFPEMDVL